MLTCPKIALICISSKGCNKYIIKEIRKLESICCVSLMSICDRFNVDIDIEENVGRKLSIHTTDFKFNQTDHVIYSWGLLTSLLIEKRIDNLNYIMFLEDDISIEEGSDKVIQEELRFNNHKFMTLYSYDQKFKNTRNATEKIKGWITTKKMQIGTQGFLCNYSLYTDMMKKLIRLKSLNAHKCIFDRFIYGYLNENRIDYQAHIPTIVEHIGRPGHPEHKGIKF